MQRASRDICSIKAFSLAMVSLAPLSVVLVLVEGGLNIIAFFFGLLPILIVFYVAYLISFAVIKGFWCWVVVANLMSILFFVVMDMVFAAKFSYTQNTPRGFIFISGEITYYGVYHHILYAGKLLLPTVVVTLFAYFICRWRRQRGAA